MPWLVGASEIWFGKLVLGIRFYIAKIAKTIETLYFPRQWKEVVEVIYK